MLVSKQGNLPGFYVSNAQRLSEEAYLKELSLSKDKTSFPSLHGSVKYSRLGLITMSPFQQHCF